MIRFSYIIPTYNRYEKLKKTISSVLGQKTEEKFEIIIIDDGSTDETHLVELYFNDPRIRYIYQKNSGVSIARNTGFNCSIGQYVIFLDSDDIVTNDQLSIISNYIEKFPNYDVYFTSYFFWKSDINEFIQRKEIANGTYTNYLVDFINGIQPCYSGCVCIDRKIFFGKPFIFKPKCNFGEDQNLWIEIFNYYNCLSIPNVTMLYRVDSDISLSKSKIIRLPPDISTAFKINTKDAKKYVLHRLSSFSMISIRDLNFRLYKEIIYFSFEKKIIIPYSIFFFKTILKKILSYIKKK